MIKMEPLQDRGDIFFSNCSLSLSLIVTNHCDFSVKIEQIVSPKKALKEHTHTETKNIEERKRDYLGRSSNPLPLREKQIPQRAYDNRISAEERELHAPLETEREEKRWVWGELTEDVNCWVSRFAFLVEVGPYLSLSLSLSGFFGVSDGGGWLKLWM